jgi:5'-nucleotidase
MTIKSILLTGDDGFNSIGTRLLVHFLKDKYDLKIVGTKYQQTGVGGKMSYLSGGEYGHTTVDGVEAIWTDGTPVDSMEVATNFFQKPFDLLISGINFGSNVSGSTVSSGTMAAALRGSFLKLSEKIIAISWYCPQNLIFKDHDGNQNIENFLTHPGKNAGDVINLAIEKDFWGADFLNINIPKEKSNKIRFTRFLPDIKDFYEYPVKLENGRFSYPAHEVFNKNNDSMNDGVAMRQGYISISPCQKTLLNERIFNKLKDEEIKL